MLMAERGGEIQAIKEIVTLTSAKRPDFTHQQTSLRLGSHVRLVPSADMHLQTIETLTRAHCNLRPMFTLGY